MENDNCGICFHLRLRWISSLIRNNFHIKVLASLSNLFICFTGYGIITAVGFAYFYHPVYHLMSAIDQLISVPKFLAVLLIICIFLVIVGTFGFLFTIRKNTQKISVQIVIMSVSWIGILVLSFASFNGYHSYIHHGLMFAVHMFNPKNPVTRYIAIIQQHMQCCGNQSPLDYNINDNFKKNFVPISCCNYQNKSLGNIKRICQNYLNLGNQLPVELSYSTGCLHRFHEIIFPTMITMSSVLLFFISINIILSVIYCSSIEYKTISKRNHLKAVFVGEICENQHDASVDLNILSTPTEFECFEVLSGKSINVVYQCSAYK